MKNTRNGNTRKTTLEQDRIRFLFLCGKGEKDFFNLYDKQRNAEDYVRLMIISLTFGLNGATLALLAKAEEGKRINEVNACFEKVKNDYATVVKWLDDFVKQIENPSLKKIAVDFWSTKKATFDERNFSLSKLLSHF